MPDMHPEDIKAAIRKRGSNLTSLAEAVGLHKQSITAAIHARVSARAEKAIADFLDMPAAKIWPSRYNKDGTRIALRHANADAAKAAARKIMA